jgi:MoxR-like ATPase
MSGRDYVLPDDIKALAVPTLAHRVILGPGARLRDLNARQIVEEIMHSVPVPGGDPTAGGGKLDPKREVTLPPGEEN